MALGATRGASRIRRIGRDNFEQEVLQSERPVLVVFLTSDTDDREVLAAIQRVLQEEQEDVSLLGMDLNEFKEVYREQLENTKYHTFDLETLPAVGLFRNGRFITTFNPRITSYEPGVKGDKIARQFRRFIDKFFRYDPEKLTFNHGK